MPTRIKPLTDEQIINAKPQAKRYLLRDGLGLEILIQTTGVKVWYFRYQSPATGKRTLFKISGPPYPDTGLAAARAWREECRALLAKGIDPQTHADNWPKLTQDARVGATTFHAGVSARLVVERAYREHEYAKAPPFGFTPELIEEARMTMRPNAEVPKIPAIWAKSLVDCWPDDANDFDGDWCIGVISEDGEPREVVKVEASQYDAAGESQKIAEAIVLLWAFAARAQAGGGS